MKTTVFNPTSSMSIYHAPLADMQFLMETIAPIDELAKLPGYEDATKDTVFAVLEQASTFATEVLDPLNGSGDREGAQHHKTDHTVTTPNGFKEAYAQFAEAGWNSLPVDLAWGGMGLPVSHCAHCSHRALSRH
jgi:3-(methylthio)propanoyl-CoA dehydrogenase